MTDRRVLMDHITRHTGVTDIWSDAICRRQTGQHHLREAVHHLSPAALDAEIRLLETGAGSTPLAGGERVEAAGKLTLISLIF
jgi:hypothetical protein